MCLVVNLDWYLFVSSAVKLLVVKTVKSDWCVSIPSTGLLLVKLPIVCLFC